MDRPGMFAQKIPQTLRTAGKFEFFAHGRSDLPHLSWRMQSLLGMHGLHLKIFHVMGRWPLSSSPS